MTYSIVMLDMDGTLSDTQDELFNVILELAEAEYGVSPEELRPKLPGLLRLSPHELGQAWWRAMGKDPAVLTDVEQSEFSRKFSARLLADQPPLFPEVPAVLDSLHKRGFTLILSSNAPSEAIKERARSAKIGGFFRLLLGTEILSGGASKTDHPHLAAERLSMTPEDFAGSAVYVGDTAGDMRVARRAGMVGIGRLSGDNAAELQTAGASHLINDLSELLPLLDSLNA